MTADAFGDELRDLIDHIPRWRSDNGAGTEALPPPRPPCLTPAEWAARELPAQDDLLGELLSTTSRRVPGDTGSGKTMFAISLAYAICSRPASCIGPAAERSPFCTWTARSRDFMQAHRSRLPVVRCRAAETAVLPEPETRKTCRRSTPRTARSGSTPSSTGSGASTSSSSTTSSACARRPERGRRLGRSSNPMCSRSPDAASAGYGCTTSATTKAAATATRAGWQMTRSCSARSRAQRRRCRLQADSRRHDAQAERPREFEAVRVELREGQWSSLRSSTAGRDPPGTAAGRQDSARPASPRHRRLRARRCRLAQRIPVETGRGVREGMWRDRCSCLGLELNRRRGAKARKGRRSTGLASVWSQVRAAWPVFLGRVGVAAVTAVGTAGIVTPVTVHVPL